MEKRRADRYKQVVYLNAENLAISESDFMEAVRGGRSAFSMTVTEGSTERMPCACCVPTKPRTPQLH